jgi:hypothetical protein
MADRTLPLMPGYARILFWISAAVAWFGVIASCSLTVSGYYADTINTAKPTLLGNTAAGIATPLERFLDWITYFTIWSNIAVAIIVTLLAIRPDLFARRDGVGTTWRALRLSSILMIIVTGAIYNLLLFEPGKTGLDLYTNITEHMATPLITLIVFIAAGPRRLITWPIIGWSLVLPVVWVIFALIRGQFIGAYPYPFLDVATKGLASVLSFVGVLLVVAVILALVLWAIDVFMTWTMIGRANATAPATKD